MENNGLNAFDLGNPTDPNFSSQSVLSDDGIAGENALARCASRQRGNKSLKSFGLSQNMTCHRSFTEKL